MKFIIPVLCVIAVVKTTPVSQDDPMLRSLMEPLMKCQNSDYYTCGKEQALRAVEKLRTLRKLKIYDGITLLNSSPKQARSLEPLSDDVSSRSLQVTNRLWQSASDIMQTGELELSFGGVDEEEEESRSIDEAEEGRGKKKKKAIKKTLKVLIPLMILAKIKAVAIVVLALVIIAASVFKIALLAKIAFIVKVIAIIKALLAKKHAQEESWENHGWEPHVEQVHTEHGHGWEGGWSRSRNEANNMAYSAYNK